MGKLIIELRPRSVIKVAVLYLIAAWAVVQIASNLFRALDLPDWTITLVAILLIVGFPIALARVWAAQAAT